MERAEIDYDEDLEEAGSNFSNPDYNESLRQESSNSGYSGYIGDFEKNGFGFDGSFDSEPRRFS